MKRKERKMELTHSQQVGVLLMMHFGGEIEGEHLSCYQCADLKQGHCPGEGRFDWRVVECMEAKAREGEIGFVWP